MSLCLYSCLSYPVSFLRSITLPRAAFLALPDPSTSSNKRKIFGKKKTEHTRYYDFLYNLSEIFLIPKGIQPDVIINVQKRSCKVTVILVTFS